MNIVKLAFKPSITTLSLRGRHFRKFNDALAFSKNEHLLKSTLKFSRDYKCLKSVCLFIMVDPRIIQIQ